MDAGAEDTGNRNREQNVGKGESEMSIPEYGTGQHEDYLSQQDEQAELAATPGRAAHDTWCADDDWDELDDEARGLWEDTAQAGYEQRVQNDAIAAQEPHAADGCPRSSTPVTADGEPHTDTCDLPEGHAGNHHCPGCGASWTMLDEYLASRWQQLQPAPEQAEQEPHAADKLAAAMAERDEDRVLAVMYIHERDEAREQVRLARDVVREAIEQVESGAPIDPATLDRWHRIAVLGLDT